MNYLLKGLLYFIYRKNINTGNSIISFKSIYINNSINHGKKNVQSNLSEITNWTFLKNV